MTDSASEPPKTRRNWLLIVSLAFNALVIGMAISAAVQHHAHGPREPLSVGQMLGEPGLRGLIRQLPKERQAALRATLSSTRQHIRDLRQAAQEARVKASM